MKERIKEIRKKAGLTQAKFGEKIGVRGNTITNYETGLRNPTDAVILSICREFNINEEWLRDGTGEMYLKMTRNQEIAQFAADLFKSEEDSFKNRLLLALSKLNEKDWEDLERIANKIIKKRD